MPLASGAAHAGGAVNDILAFIAAYWWLAILFGGAISAFLEGVRDFFLALGRYALEGGQRRHERRLEVIRAQHGGQLPGGVREDGSVATVDVRPRGCSHPHERVRDVYAAGELVAYICTRCDAQLPLHQDEGE